MHCLVKHEIVLPSLKDDCHPGLAHFGNDQFLIRKDKEGEENVIRTMDSFSFDVVQPIQVPFKKLITNNAKMVFKQCFF